MGDKQKARLKGDVIKMKVMVYEESEFNGFKQVGLRVVREDDSDEYVIVRGEKRQFFWQSENEVTV